LLQDIKKFSHCFFCAFLVFDFAQFSSIFGKTESIFYMLSFAMAKKFERLTDGLEVE